MVLAHLTNHNDDVKPVVSVSDCQKNESKRDPICSFAKIQLILTFRSTPKWLWQWKNTDAGNQQFSLPCLTWWCDPPMTGQDVCLLHVLLSVLCSSFSRIKQFARHSGASFLAQHGKQMNCTAAAVQIKHSLSGLLKTKLCEHLTHTKSKQAIRAPKPLLLLADRGYVVRKEQKFKHNRARPSLERKNSIQLWIMQKTHKYTHSHILSDSRW